MDGGPWPVLGGWDEGVTIGRAYHYKQCVAVPFRRCRRSEDPECWKTATARRQKEGIAWRLLSQLRHCRADVQPSMLTTL